MLDRLVDALLHILAAMTGTFFLTFGLTVIVSPWALDAFSDAMTPLVVLAGLGLVVLGIRIIGDCLNSPAWRL
jgi:hypothetical protein